VEKAARLAGVALETALGWLEQPRVVKKLRRMREKRLDALGEEAASDRLLSLLSGSPADVVKLAFLPPDTPPDTLDGMDFSQLAACKRLSNGTMELKLIDRVEALLALIEAQNNGDKTLSPLLRALAPETRENADE
jgi:hypothetical protein